MEFHEKLQELRKSRGLTQEELAEALFVSRTAISKWESRRGYPSIDSLKEISRYFAVSIDDLLSGEQLITIAEKENRSNLNTICDLLLGFVDLFSLMLIFLPLYPKPVNGYIYAVNLFDYVDEKLETNDGCDHSLTFTREFLEKQKVDVESVLDWIINEGGGCDCEVLYNVEERFEE